MENWVLIPPAGAKSPCQGKKSPLTGLPILDLKTCTKCGVAKPATAECWNRHKLGVLGLNPVCKDCRKAQEAQRRAAPGHAEKQKRWREEHRERFLGAMASWKQRNHGYAISKDREYYAEHREECNAARREYYQKHRGEHYRKAREWVEANRDKCREYARAYITRYPHLVLERVRLRQAAKLKRSPRWLTVNHRKQMAELYRECRALCTETGVEHQVDHVVPLRGRLVSGLHVPWNLQIITASENQKKGARFNAV